MFNAFFPLRFSAILLAGLLLAGCSGVREHIRERDYRAVQASSEPAPAASPIANVADMPGWTTDLGSAQEFARENGLRTVVFVQQPGHPASERSKDVLNSEAVESAIGQDMRVTVDLASSGFDAGRVDVDDAPALVVLDSQGNAVARRTGALSQRAVLEALGQ